MEASSSISPGIPPPPPSSMYSVKRSFSTPCDPREDEDGCNIHLSQRLAKTPPLTPKKGGKMLALKIHLLDDTVTIIQAQTKALGRVVFDQVCKQLNILEADYFGLEYQDSYGTKYWLDLEKRLSRQVGLSLGDPVLRFSVKFYTPDPSQLEEEFTRYLFSLQIKRDLATGILQCNDNTAALMASFIVQAECGDFNDEDYPNAGYLSTFKFVPHQDAEMEKRIRENHRKHVGQSPAEADLHLLETARRTELFGIKMHPAKDEEGVPLNLSVCHLGVVVFQNFTKINTFSWAKIRKISFKRKRFILKLHPEGFGYYKETVEFLFETRNECKSFWKRCVEHHAFFRCEKAPSSLSGSGRSKGLLTSRGSSFRYSGRTQKQMVAFVRENFVKRGAPPMGSSQFQRSASFRSAHNVMSSASMSVGGGGPHSGVSTSCSSPAMMSHASAVLPIDDQVMDRVYPNMDYPDSPVEIRSQDSQQDTLSPGTSVTSSPQRYVPAAAMQAGVIVDQVVGPPPPPVAVYHPQYPPQGQSISQSHSLAHTPELFDDDDEELSDESFRSDVKRFGSFGQNEFPVTTVRNIEKKLKVFEAAQGMMITSSISATTQLGSSASSNSKETIRRTRKQRSKSLTVRSEIVSEDDDELNNFFTIPRRKEKLQKRKVTDDEFHRPGDETTSQGSYDLLVSTERMDELSSRSRRLIHQKESLYDELDDPVMSPTAVISTSATTPPTRTPPAIVTPARTPPKVVTTPTNTTAPASAPKKTEKRVLTLKSEEQLVEEAGIWLEAGAISTSGSFKRKMNKKKQEALEKLESEIIPNAPGRPGRERSRHQSRKELLSPRASLDRTSCRPHERYTRSHSSPIEVEVSIVPPPPPSDIPLIIPRKVKPPPPCDIPLKPSRNNINNNPLVAPTKSLPPEPVKPIPKPRAAEEQQPHTNGTAEILTRRDDKQQQQPQHQQQPEPKYLIPANEIIPLSKSELEPVLEDTSENEPPVPDTPTAITTSNSSSSTARKNFVRKTKSEGAFDTASKAQSSLKRSSTEKKPGRGTERGESSGGRAAGSDEHKPNKSSIHFEEVDVPYLLRRRYDLDYPSSTPGSTTNFYHHHESLSKSKSYGGTSTDGSSTSQQLKRLVYCSMTDLPPVTNFSWRDDTFDGPPIWDEIDPFSLAVRRGQRGGGGVPRANIRKIRSEELETAATDLLDDIMKTVNVEFVKDLTEVHELIPPPMFQTLPDIETIQEEQESAPVRSGSEEEEDDDDMMMSGSEDEISSEGEKVYEPEEFAKLAEKLSAVYEEEEERVDERDLDKLSETEVCGESPEELDIDDEVDDYNPDEDNPEEEPELEEEEEQFEIPVPPPRQDSLDVPAEFTPEICEETPGEGSISTVAEIPEIPEEEGDMSVGIVDDIEIPQELPAVLEDLAVAPATAPENPALVAAVEGPGKVTAEDPAKETVEDPAEVTVEDPAEVTAEDPAEVTAEEPAEVTAEDPTKVIDEIPAIVPAEDPAGPTVAPSSSSTVKAAGPPSPKPPVPEKPADLLLRKLRKDSTASLDDFPLPPLPDADGEYNCETPRYPPPPPDILQFNYPSRRGSYNRRRSSADLEQGSITDSLTTVVENAALEIVNRRLHFSRTFSISDEDDNNSVKPVLPPRRSSVSDEANIPPAIAEEDPALISPATPLPPPPVTTSSHPPPLLASSTLSMADSFSKQSSSDSLPDPPDPLYDCVESRNSDTVSEKSESPEAPLFLNLAAGTIGFPRTLSRISERTHSSEETESTSQFIQKIESGLRKKLEEASSLSAMDDLDFPCMRKLSSNNDTSADLSGSLNAPLATLTSELADSSATLNDLEEIGNEEVEDFVDDEVGNANLPTELKPEIVQAKDEDGDEDDEDTFGAQEITRDDTTTTSQRHRVEVSLTVKDDPDWLHYMCKEIMSTHRTFMTDLKVMGKPVSALLSPNSSLLHNLEGLVDIKKELWEAGSHGVQVISCLGKHFEHARLRYEEYFLGLQSTFEEFIEAEDFSHYLPLTALALKPLYRILYYWQDVLPVFRTYETDTIRQHCSKLEVILSPLVSIVNSLQSDLESRAKIGELTREMPGCPNNPGKFLLQGILLKLSRRRGLQNRIFFLFNDYIMYGVRVSSAAGFRLHGIVPLYETEMQQNFELEHQLGSSIPHAFSLITQQDKVLVLAAMTEKDKILWMSALVDAIGKARPNQSSLKSIGYSSEELLLSGSQDGIVNSSENNNNVSTLLRNNNQVGHRSNATPHVCWHRNVSISHAELCKGFQCTISGFLLRKFKNSPGWQRLWVVFTNICLFFYKSFDDSSPLASLPLLGYRVDTPVEEDGITKDHVFKLVFKNHVYFFRAESKFTFKRWMRALNQAIQLPGQYK